MARQRPVDSQTLVCVGVGDHSISHHAVAALEQTTSQIQKETIKAKVIQLFQAYASFFPFF